MLLKNESQVTTWYLNRWRNEVWQNGWVYKIADVWRGLKPFDVVGATKDKFFVREFKYIRTQKITYEMVYQHLELHQITNLYRVSQLGREALVIAYHADTKEYIIYPFKLLNDGTETWKKETEKESKDCGNTAI